MPEGFLTTQGVWYSAYPSQSGFCRVFAKSIYDDLIELANEKLSTEYIEQLKNRHQVVAVQVKPVR